MVPTDVDPTPTIDVIPLRTVVVPVETPERELPASAKEEPPVELDWAPGEEKLDPPPPVEDWELPPPPKLLLLLPPLLLPVLKDWLFDWDPDDGEKDPLDPADEGEKDSPADEGEKDSLAPALPLIMVTLPGVLLPISLFPSTSPPLKLPGVAVANCRCCCGGSS